MAPVGNLQNNAQLNDSHTPSNRSAYIWNTISGLLAAFQSVILLIVITRVCDLATAGIFVIAFTIANQFLLVGKFGMRNYQSSDVAEQYRFGEYALSRALTTFIMIIGVVVYTIVASAQLDYDMTKSLAIILMGLHKALDSVEDVYYGDYQRFGRLDVAGRLMTIRGAGTILAISVCLVLFKDLTIALAFSLLLATMLMIGVLLFARLKHGLPSGRKGVLGKQTLHLLKENLVLFLTSFLLFYVINAPRYAIDALAGDATQAIYSFIAMPLFVVSLFASFVYAPMIAPLSQIWQDGKNERFKQEFLKQLLWVALIAIACTAAAWLFGIPVLNWLYNADVSDYLIELCVLVAGGGFYAVVTLFTVGLTIIRKQVLLLFSYCAITIVSYFTTTWAVTNWGIAGASWVYLALMVLMAAGVMFTLLIAIRKH
ncbi:MAG: oligosaccharide flippase family protein [Coriobacteriales bacterium]|nr:oligosaccharide flippase family protein [Coriobacteriales bacterium]